MSQDLGTNGRIASTTEVEALTSESSIEGHSRVKEACAKFASRAKSPERSSDAQQPQVPYSVKEARKSFEVKTAIGNEEEEDVPTVAKAPMGPKRQGDWRRPSSRILSPHFRLPSEDAVGGVVNVGGRAKEAGHAKNEGHIVNIHCLIAKDLGKFRLQPATTFSELRAEVARKLGHSNFTFQDRETKRQWTNENIPILSMKAPILVSQSGLDNLLADSTFQDKSNVTIMPDGTTAFKLFWWDSLNHTRRSVWLKFEPQRISVTSAGGSFRLFDANGLRSNLRFASVRGSNKGFQFVKGRMASRFFATSVEQKNTLSIYFCFVWRPNAVRKGWLPPLEDPMSNAAADATDPRMFSNLLRQHLVEVDQIVKDIERSMDPRAVRSYIKMFIQMFSGGYSINGPNAEGGILHKAVGDRQLDALGQLRDGLGLDRDVAEEPSPKRSATGRSGVGKDNGDFFEMNSSSENNTSPTATGSDGNAAPIPLPPGGVPPPPCPPGGPLIQKPPICPVNFEGISAHDIPGTVWADLSDFSLKERQLARLTDQLKLIFGKESRERSVQEVDESMGALEAGRLRNLEVLLNMEELKGLTYSAIVDLILEFDDSLFASYSVLERLSRRSTKEGGIQYAFLPSAAEAEALVTFAEQNGEDALRPGEYFFLEMAIRVPDRVQRFEYGSFMAKFDMELPGIESELARLRAADQAVRESERFKRALKTILEILTTLMPRFGLTRGFRISSFLPSTERVNGTVANPSEGRVSIEDQIAEIEASVDASLPEKERRKQIKLAMMRKKVQTSKEKDFWAVRLQEFIACFTNRFEGCEGFWEDLIETCDAAMRVDQVALDQQTGEWLLQLEEVKEYYEYARAQGEKNQFMTKIGQFVASRGPVVTKIRSDVLNARKQTDLLWKWMGEVMGGDPSLIFKHIHDFSAAFEAHWKALENSWEHRKTRVLRGDLALEKYVPVPKEEVEERKRQIAAKAASNSKSPRGNLKGTSGTLREALRASTLRAGTLRGNQNSDASSSSNNSNSGEKKATTTKKSSAVAAMAAALAERREVDDEMIAGSSSSDLKETDTQQQPPSLDHSRASSQELPAKQVKNQTGTPPYSLNLGPALSRSENESFTTSQSSSDMLGSSSSDAKRDKKVSPPPSPSSKKSSPRRKSSISAESSSMTTSPSKKSKKQKTTDASSKASSQKKKSKIDAKSDKSPTPSQASSYLELMEPFSDEEPMDGPRPRSSSQGDIRHAIIHPAKYPIPGKETADDSSPVLTRRKKNPLKKMMKLKF